ncbi:MAG: hypothetical protein L6V87_04995 [Ruminococcus sp.]|nr:MAG: hypothetical protein L6V87_04995 [Ruminococcus sp.]
MEETLKKQKFSVYNIIFIIVVIAQLIFLSVSFAVNNTAHHEDEYFSYGLANSQNRVYLYGSAFQVPDNYNVWMTGDDFKYYIETNEESRFSYDTVWKNQAADTHPPLYYAVLHTICSFFPDQFSWWWAFGINLFLLCGDTGIFVQVFLKICKVTAGGCHCLHLLGAFAGRAVQCVFPANVYDAHHVCGDVRIFQPDRTYG